MTQITHKPVVLLAFANARNEGYLAQLKKESSQLYHLFSPLHRSGQIELLREESLEHTELAKLLSQHKGLLEILHYGGHADSKSLSLEDGPGHVAGIAKMLELQSRLKLVFLNGCHTQEQAKPFLQAGIPVVIATTRSIADEEATFFAEHFYHALTHDHSLKEAFVAASGALKARSSYELSGSEVVTIRSLAIGEEKLEEMPWRMYVQEGNDKALGWKLNGPTGPISSSPNIRQKLWKGILTAGVIIALLAGLAELTGYSLRDLLGKREVESFSVTVLVHGKKGKDDRILRDQGYVVLDFGKARQEASINEKGEATFKEIPIGFLGQAALISINHPQPYLPKDSNKEYQLEDKKSIYLEVELKGLHKITGRIRDFDTEQPLDSVRVSYQRSFAYTDQVGWFELQIPDSIQSKFIKVNFYKAGYKMEDVDSIAPHLQQPIGLALKKE